MSDEGLYDRMTRRIAERRAKSPYVGYGMMVVKCQDCGHNNKHGPVHPCEECGGENVELEPLTKKEFESWMDLSDDTLKKYFFKE